MMMDTRIPLMGREMQPIDAFVRGVSGAEMVNAAREQQAQRNFFQQHGADVMAGDPQALSIMAQFNPEGAMQIQAHHAAQARAQAASSRAAASAEASKIRNEVGAALLLDSAEAWDARMTEIGQDALVGGFDQRYALAARFLGAADTLELKGTIEEADVPALGEEYSNRIELADHLGFTKGTAAYNALVIEGERLDLPQGGVAGEDLIELETDLRKEWNALKPVKDYTERGTAHASIVAAASLDSAAGDIALLIGYMKMLDPGSVVRESEFATIESAQSLPEQIRQMGVRLASGERLSPERRSELISASTAIYESAGRQYESIKDFYSSTATRYGVDPDNVFTPYEYVGEDTLTPESFFELSTEEKNAVPQEVFERLYNDMTEDQRRELERLRLEAAAEEAASALTESTAAPAEQQTQTQPPAPPTAPQQEIPQMQGMPQSQSTDALRIWAEANWERLSDDEKRMVLNWLSVR